MGSPMNACTRPTPIEATRPPGRPLPAPRVGVAEGDGHGAVSLELAGYEGAANAEARFQDLLAAAAAWFFAAR